MVNGNNLETQFGDNLLTNLLRFTHLNKSKLSLPPEEATEVESIDFV